MKFFDKYRPFPGAFGLSCIVLGCITQPTVLYGPHRPELNRLMLHDVQTGSVPGTKRGVYTAEVHRWLVRLFTTVNNVCAGAECDDRVTSRQCTYPKPHTNFLVMHRQV